MDPTKPRYPKNTFLILVDVFGKKFSFNGFQAILPMFLKFKLDYNEDTSTVIFHAFIGLFGFFSILGGVLADQYIGKFKAILWTSLVYLIGLLMFPLISIQQFSLPERELTMVALFLIAFGCGCIMSCLPAFGGDQFKLPSREKHMKSFFNYIYITTNAASLLSYILIPMLRTDIHCLGDDACYSLAFGVLAVALLSGTIILAAGTKSYAKQPPTGSIITEVFCSMGYAMTRRFNTTEKHGHWLDHAKNKYSSQLIEDSKQFLRLLVIFIPTPIYWALYFQQGSKWLYQATRMNGTIGSWEIKPDQMRTFNPICTLLLAPLFDCLFYPLLARCNILKTSLQKMVTGGVFMALSFIISGILEHYINQEDDLHMLWQVPQYVAVVIGEIMFMVATMEFAYSQAPTSMKSVLQALNVCMQGLGNIITMIIVKIKIFDDQANEFFMFGILMLLDMALLAYIAYKYTYVDTKEDSNNSNCDSSTTTKSEVNSESTDTCSA